MTEKLKRTPLFDEHVKSKARIVAFGGWEMPVQYKGVVIEHRAVREAVGLFDVSHMGEIFVTGKDALGFLQYVAVNDLTRIGEGQAQYTVMCYENGGMVDDILIYRFDRNRFMLVVNAANIDKDDQWLRQCLEVSKGRFSDVAIENKSDDFAQIAVQGPKSEALLARVVNIDLGGLDYYHFEEDAIFGHEVIVSRTGYTGEAGFELYLPGAAAAKVWRKLLEESEDLGGLPIGLGARDTLRFEVCFPLYGQELTADVTPIQAGLKWVVRMEKPDFIGRSVIAEQVENGVSKRLVGLEMVDKGIARTGYKVTVDREGKQEVGCVTSGTRAPSIDKSVALAYVDVAHAKIGSAIFVMIHNKMKQAIVVKRPFYKKQN